MRRALERLGVSRISRRTCCVFRGWRPATTAPRSTSTFEALMRTTADAAASRAEQAGLEFVVHASEGPIEIMGDSAKLRSPSKPAR